MKIAILYICTGKYKTFWTDFYKTSTQFFLPGYEKHYFVFTDSESIESSESVTVIHKKCQGFPKDSLFRFKIFLEIENKLNNFNYIFFFNSNMLFVDNVGGEILPIESENGLVAVLHPGHYNNKNYFFPYERNKKSKAYIPHKKGTEYHYFMGGLNGGQSKQYLDLIRTCAKNIDEDYAKGLMAIYHDESHLNKYLLDKNILIKSPAYGYPENLILPFEPKIIIRDKIAVDPFYKKQSINLIHRIINKIQIVYKAIIW
jgi:hypothetical protein